MLYQGGRRITVCIPYHCEGQWAASTVEMTEAPFAWTDGRVAAR